MFERDDCFTRIIFSFQGVNSRFRGRPIYPFCDKVKQDPLETECTEDRSSVSLCNLVPYPEKLPQIYQNFDSIPHVPKGKEFHYGGSVSMADFCPYTQEFTWRSNNVVVRGSHCKYIENNPRKHHLKFTINYGNFIFSFRIDRKLFALHLSFNQLNGLMNVLFLKNLWIFNIIVVFL